MKDACGVTSGMFVHILTLVVEDDSPSGPFVPEGRWPLSSTYPHRPRPPHFSTGYAGHSMLHLSRSTWVSLSGV